jgi:hypothetical protein
MTMDDNLKFNKKVKDNGYPVYDNYNAIEIGWVDAIPSDHDGVMGVPITFLDKYNPDQFEILGITKTWNDHAGFKTRVYPKQIQVTATGSRSEVGKLNDGPAIRVDTAPKTTYYEVGNEMFIQRYARLLVRLRR